MANIKQLLQEAAEKSGEAIEFIVVGQHDSKHYSSPTLADENIILSASVGLAKLDLEYDNGFGGAECFPMYAWTASRVYLISEYDGATGLSWVPRHPVDCVPQFGGMDSYWEAQGATAVATPLADQA